MAQLIKEPTFVGFFFKKDLEKIRNCSTMPNSQKKILRNVYLAIREILLDVDEGRVNSQITEKLIEEYSGEVITNVGFLLTKFETLGIDTHISLVQP